MVNIGSTFFATTSVTVRQGNCNLEEFRPIETKTVNSTEKFDAKWNQVCLSSYQYQNVSAKDFHHSKTIHCIENLDSWMNKLTSLSLPNTNA